MEERLDKNLIAPCGINCAICVAHLRDNNICPGCNFSDPKKPKTRTACKIKNCTERQGSYCFECNQFPCSQLQKLNKRYMDKYQISEIKNLELIRDLGVDKFLDEEKNKWLSKKGIICMHNKKYYKDK